MNSFTRFPVCAFSVHLRRYAEYVIFVYLLSAAIPSAVSESLKNLENVQNLLQHTPRCSPEPGKLIPCILQSDCSTNADKNFTSSECTFTVYSKNIFRTDNASEDDGMPDIDIVIKPPTTLEVWVSGLLSAFAISFSGVVGYLLAPLITSSFQRYVLNTLIGLAFGSLTSTALLQLIPEAYHLMLYVPDYMSIALFTVVGIWILYVIQTLTSIIFDNNKLEATSKHNHSFHPMTTVVTKITNGNGGNNDDCSAGIGNCYHEPTTTNADLLLNTSETHTKSNNNVTATATFDNHKLYYVSEAENNNKQKYHHHNHGHHHHHHAADITSSSNKPSALAWLIILGDGLHNFIDGVSIGAGYTQSLTTGFSMTLAIACEEYPHELGDFAILLQSGLSIKKAALYNYLSATSIILGVVIGIILGELKFSPFIFSSSAGLFLYVALSNLMPELKEMIAESLLLGKKSALNMLFCQCVGFTIGFTALFLITTRNHVP